MHIGSHHITLYHFKKFNLRARCCALYLKSMQYSPVLGGGHSPTLLERSVMSDSEETV